MRLIEITEAGLRAGLKVVRIAGCAEVENAPQYKAEITAPGEMVAYMPGDGWVVKRGAWHKWRMVAQPETHRRYVNLFSFGGELVAGEVWESKELAEKEADGECYGIIGTISFDVTRDYKGGPWHRG